jgi:hypothetical protein
MIDDPDVGLPREKWRLDPSALALLEQKARALDQAAPLVGWELPECFDRLRRLLEARLSKGGKREYVQVLRLLGTFSIQAIIQERNGSSETRAISSMSSPLRKFTT